MARQDDLERWWNGLTAHERAEAQKAGEAGRLTEALEKSLAKAGLLDQGKGKGRKVPGEVVVFLKTRH